MTAAGAHGSDGGHGQTPMSRRERRDLRRRRRLVVGGLLVLMTILASAVAVLGVRRDQAPDSSTGTPTGSTSAGVHAG